MFPLLAIFSDYALLALRLVLCTILIVHGWPKLKNLRGTAQNFSAMGFRPGSFLGPLVAFLEFFGGIALAAGIYVQVFAGLFAAQFVVISVWKAAKRQPFIGGLEFDLLILVASLALLTLGGGVWQFGWLQ